MMPGFYADLAKLALAQTELRLQQEEAARQAAAQAALQQALFDQYRQKYEDAHGMVIDVDAREVPDVQQLPAPANALPIRDQVGTTERDANE